MDFEESTGRTMANLQEADYGADRDYLHGSPHLAHGVLRRQIESDLVRLVSEQLARRGVCRVLEVGAGHGTFTQTLLEAGATVTVTEMSQPSAQFLAGKFANAEGVDVIYDPSGELAASHSANGDLLVMISVLHHIPDYVDVVSTLASQMNDGASIYCAQDPLWYPDRGRWDLLRDRASYMLWRAFQGNTGRALKTRIRRARGLYDENNPADMVEYHVVRDGVDQDSLVQSLEARCESVELRRYWTTQSALLQRFGTSRGWTSTFSITARGLHPHRAVET